MENDNLQTNYYNPTNRMILLNDVKKFILALLFLVAGISLNKVYAADTNALLIGDCRVTLDNVQSGGSFT
ncbi:MAG: hypothetical protein K6G62_01405, partial [Eubacterium sp.]|nr:hypothetical protein [Eubacterium sp.]